MTATNVVLSRLVAPLALSAMTDYLKGTLGSSLTAEDIGGEFKIVRKSDGVTVFAKDTKNFTNRWACFLSNATNPKVPFAQRGTTENVINEKGTLTTQDQIKERYEMVVTSWAPSSEFPQRRPNGEKAAGSGPAPVLGILDTLKLAQQKLESELNTLRDQQEQLTLMVAAKEKEIRKGAKAIAFYSSDDEDEDETNEGLA